MGDKASPRKCAQWYQALLQNVKMFDAMYRAVARNGPSISAIKFQEMDTIAMVILEARDNIVAADGVTTYVENAVQWVSLTMMKLRQCLLSSEDPSRQLNLKLIEIFKKSLNENVKKSSHDGRNAIFVMIQGLVWEKDPEVVEEEQETYPAKQELLDDAIDEEETPPDNDKNYETQAANKSIFDRPDQHALEEKKLREKEVRTEPRENFTKNTKQPDGTPRDVTNQDLIENPVKPNAAMKNAVKHEPLDAIAQIETPDDDKTEASKSIFEMTGQLVLDEKLLEQDEVQSHSKEDFDEEPIESKVTAIKPLQNFTEADETKKPTDTALGENPVKPPQDSIEDPTSPCQNLIENLYETKTSKSNVQKESFFNFESKAALMKHAKHNECEDEEGNDVEATLLSPFDPGIK